MSNTSSQTSENFPALRAAAGMATLGKQVVVHGKDLHRECLDMSFVHYFMFCATGREFDARAARVFERLWISTGYPDARIWCNRIAGYLGSARVDPAMAVSAALAASNGTAYGFRAISAAYSVQAKIPESISEREAWLTAVLETRTHLAGYGRPIHGSDERIDVALAILVEAKLRAGPALRRAFWLHERLRESKGIEMNIAALWGAVAIDFGMTAREYDAFNLLMFTPGYIAVFSDQRARGPLEFLSGFQAWRGAARDEASLEPPRGCDSVTPGAHQNTSR